MSRPEIVAETAEHPLPDGHVTLLGAVHGVTGAMTRVELGGSAILVDCGKAQGDEARGFRFPERARDVTAVILTHGHLDHVGSLPTLLDGDFSGPIYGTHATLEVANYILRDALVIEGVSQAEFRRFCHRFMKLRRDVEYDTPITIPGFDGTVELREAGHILGSASVDLQTRASRVIVSGDLGRPDSPILRDYAREWGERPVDLVVMESTYGDRIHEADHEDVEHALERILLGAIERRGHVIIPAFALGRTQALLYHLNTLFESKRVPAIPVAVDTPLGLRITETYAARRELYDDHALELLARGDDPLSFEKLYAVWKGRDSARLRGVKGPLVILAGSGMVTGGRVVGHLRDHLPLSASTIVFAGFQARGTPGREILAAGEAQRRGERVYVELEGDRIPVRATIENLTGLSAHADQDELLAWARNLPAPKRIALHHGQPEAQRILAAKLAEALRGPEVDDGSPLPVARRSGSR
jgi:metallo-beta-lactamase family protein